MDWNYIAATVTGGVIGSLIVLGAQAFVRWLSRPHLHVVFDSRLSGCVMPTPESLGDGTSRQAIYFSLAVSNNGRRTAKKCRGFLAGVDFKDEKGTWQPTEFCDNMPLVWAYRTTKDATHGIEIPAAISQFLNVFSESDGDSAFLPRTAPSTLKGRAERFAKQGEFRFRIFVTADEADMKPYCVTLRWEGRFDRDVTVRQSTTWP